MSGLRHYEDFAEGEVRDFGRYEVTREEIIAFAEEFDPQPFHLDDAAALASPLDGLAASGWHVCAMLMRMMCDGYLLETAGMGSPGIDEMKWLKPVRPDDMLTARYTVLSRRVSAKRPDMGIVSMRYDVFDQRAERKCEMTGINLIKLRRP